MKRTVPFSKTITFRTMIAEITNIEVTHDLKLKDDYEISGDILVDGTYKMTDASQIEEEFHYKLPFTIEVDSKYDTSNLEIIISDFYFEIINEEDLKINIEIEMAGLKEKEVEIISSKLSLDDELLENETEIEIEKLVRNDELESYQIPVEIDDDYLKEEDKLLSNLEKELKEDLSLNYKSPKVEILKEKTVENNNVGSIFSNISSSEETFSTYYVYIVRENDTVEEIIDKYKTTKEELLNYNDLNDIKIGSKLIIPCTNNE